MQNGINYYWNSPFKQTSTEEKVEPNFTVGEQKKTDFLSTFRKIQTFSYRLLFTF